MNKIILGLAIVLLSASIAFAQDRVVIRPLHPSGSSIPPGTVANPYIARDSNGNTLWRMRSQNPGYDEDSPPGSFHNPYILEREKPFKQPREMLLFDEED